MNQVTRELVDAIGDAFNANDIDAVMQYFAPDAVFDHAAGADEHGTRFKGAETIRGVFAGLFDKVDTVHWETLDCRIVGDKAFCEYRRTARHSDGTTEEFLSVDILTFKGGMITHKDTYYKQRS
ncbi:MAG: nuclear transport factor 2 family protein [Pseudomonadota bacterium]